MSFIETISGTSTSYNLRHRVFNLFVFFGATAAIFDIIVSFLIVNPDRMFLSFLISGVFALTFYLSRVRRWFSNQLIIISAVLIITTLGISFFYDAGSQGKIIPLLILSMSMYFLSSK